MPTQSRRFSTIVFQALSPRDLIRQTPLNVISAMPLLVQAYAPPPPPHVLVACRSGAAPGESVFFRLISQACDH
ncbi:hypothetical protein B0T18DRAFT_104703 [Schizothecium vesticola]|uniref:Uncharacterized protein n=1 Tax=Schizothecium vesticola TaxID=314040 RepID=A0AA40K808_9PEZI|nr:hypothetical protein B0T18DRAFT_104703 [Schizothecium vesticola]